MQIPTSDFLAMVTVTTGATLACLKIIDYLVRKLTPPTTQQTKDSTDIETLERIMVDHQRENRQTFKEIRDGILKLCVLMDTRQ